jgi:hypothetical protein
MDPQDVTACGMSMGFGDAEARVNRMGMPRQPLKSSCESMTESQGERK